MSISNGNWFGQRVLPVVRGSALGRAAGRLLPRREAAVRQAATDTRGASERRLDFDLVAPVVKNSRIAQAVARGWPLLSSAVAESRTTSLLTLGFKRIAAIDAEQRVGLCAWAIAVASVTHLVTLLTLDPYEFPRRTALILPAIVAGVALIVTARRRDVVRALRERRSR